MKLELSSVKKKLDYVRLFSQQAKLKFEKILFGLKLNYFTKYLPSLKALD